MEYTTMALPCSLLEKEDELLSVGILRRQPTNLVTFEPLNLPTLLPGPPVPPYIVVARGYNGHPKLGDTSYTPNRSW
jgi:hypothetical protein